MFDLSCPVNTPDCPNAQAIWSEEPVHTLWLFPPSLRAERSLVWKWAWGSKFPICDLSAMFPAAKQGT